MPLNFDDRGLLPPGVHDATLDEVSAVFGRFQRSDRRMTLYGKLKAYLAELGKTGWSYEVVIDGSFIMPAVDEPNDIDMILVLPANWDMPASCDRSSTIWCQRTTRSRPTRSKCFP